MLRPFPPLRRRTKPRAVPKSRAKANKAPPPKLPELDKDGVPAAFNAILRAARRLYDTRDKRRTLLADLADAEMEGLDRTTLVTFIWMMKGIEDWVCTNSEVRKSLWKDAEKLRKLAVTFNSPTELERVKASKKAHTTNWAKTYQALACLGFALECGYKDQSVALWRLIEPALLRDVFNKPTALQRLLTSRQEEMRLPRIHSRDHTQEYSEEIRQHLHYHRRKHGMAKTQELAERAFATIKKTVLTHAGIVNIHKYPPPSSWPNP